MRNKLVLCTVLLAVVTYCSAQQAGSVSAGYKVGSYEVFVLTEGGGDAEISFLKDAPAEVTDKYAPDGIFPIATHAVLVKGKDKVWLIDTGYGWNVVKNMQKVGVEPEDVDHILLTHLHGDHIGGMLADGKPVFPNSSVTVGETEVAYWTSDAEMNKLSADQHQWFHMAQAVLAAYTPKVEYVKSLSLGSDYGDGIFPIEAYGHTPGHIMFLISDGGEKLLVCGDIIHALPIQMPHPEISAHADINPGMAAETRIKVLEYLAGKDIAVIGMHIPVAQPGKVVKDPASGGYKFESNQPYEK